MMLAGGAVVLDLKATTTIEALHKAQVLSYMAVTNAELGLIMNFGAASLQFERFPNFLTNRQPQQNLVTSPMDGLYPELTRRLLDVLFTAQRTLGPGFLHQIYRRATRIELSHNQMNHSYLKELPLRFQGQAITHKETRLFWIEQRLLLATVALTQVTHVHTEKLRWAMRETNCQLGLIANFYPSQLEVRFIRLSAKT
jgi:GxxExxY protein